MSDINIDLIPAFPHIMMKFNVPDYESFKDELISYIYEQKELDSLGVFKSNNGGWQSKEISDLPMKFQEKLFPVVSSCLNDYLKDHLTCSIGNLWLNVNPQGSSNDRHTHPGADLSAVFWVKTSGDSGMIEFENPSHFVSFKLIDSIDDDVKDPWNCSHSMWVKPDEGCVMIFPSYVIHRVMPNEMPEDRISISWNMTIVNK